jgi:hypothetical protein
MQSRHVPGASYFPRTFVLFSQSHAAFEAPDLSCSELGTNKSKVTVISLSNRSARVIQGIVDFKNESIEIRVAPSFDFMAGVQNENMALYLTVMGWLVGNPVGKTKGDNIWESIGKTASSLYKNLWAS